MRKHFMVMVASFMALTGCGEGTNKVDNMENFDYTWNNLLTCRFFVIMCPALKTCRCSKNNWFII